MNTTWNVRGGHQNIYRYTDADEHRIGHCGWGPQGGDICIRTEDVGDWFHNYIAIRPNADGTWSKCGEFGAYVFGELLGTLGRREFFLLRAGEPVTLPETLHQKITKL